MDGAAGLRALVTALCTDGVRPTDLHSTWTIITCTCGSALESIKQCRFDQDREAVNLQSALYGWSKADGPAQHMDHHNLNLRICTGEH
eukprot:1161252-Pelagomonas_calceolata.AAC.9